MPYVLKEIFGNTKRISILEELIERWGEFLKVSEIVRMSGATKRTVNNHLRELDEIGLLEIQKGKTTRYKLKENDKRCLALAMVENEESIRKLEINLIKSGK